MLETALSWNSLVLHGDRMHIRHAIGRLLRRPQKLVNKYHSIPVSLGLPPNA